jgi:hypothetical protein
MDNKPTLHLASVRAMSLQSLGGLYRRLTGREPTDEEMAGLRVRWARIEKTLAERSGAAAPPSRS